MTETTSTALNGEQFPLPTQQDEAAELQRLQALTADHRAQGREIVVVMGKNLTATYTYEALCLADVIVVGIGGHDAASRPPIPKETLGNCRQGHAEIAALEESLKVLGEKIQPHCLVLIETTVPPGTTEYVAYPILKKAFEGRGIATEPLLAHSYERVMPGREYVASIRDFWRVCSGINYFSSSPARGSAATASPRTGGWASGPISPSWASRTTSSRSRRLRSTSTTPAPSTWRSSSGTPFGTWGRSSPPPRSLSSAPPTGRT